MENTVIWEIISHDEPTVRGTSTRTAGPLVINLIPISNKCSSARKCINEGFIPLSTPWHLVGYTSIPTNDVAANCCIKWIGENPGWSSSSKFWHPSLRQSIIIVYSDKILVLFDVICQNRQTSKTYQNKEKDLDTIGIYWSAMLGRALPWLCMLMCFMKLTWACSCYMPRYQNSFCTSEFGM